MSVHVCKCVHNGTEEHHICYPGMTHEAAQELADRINGGWLVDPQRAANECAASRALDAWVQSHGKPCPWNVAVKIIAIVQKLPDVERDRLLALGDKA